ncbi:MAG TPA: type II toxin-antitoxin system prevent-host-death family antitoxin [Phytomonospora sp.]
MTQIAEKDLGTLGALLDRAAAGEAVLVTRDGKPIAEVFPTGTARPRRRRLVPTAEAQRLLAGLPSIDYAQMRAEADAILGEDRA